MSDASSDADSISDASSVDFHEAVMSAISSRIREMICHWLRVNDPRIFTPHSSAFIPFKFQPGYTEAECIAVFQALKENTSVKHIDLSLLFQPHNSKRSTWVAAEYLESSKTLQTLDFNENIDHYSHAEFEKISIVLRALSRNTSVTKLIVNTDVVRFASMAFEELLTRTQTLQKMKIIGSTYEDFDEVQTAAITSGFANNTTLRDLEFQDWRDAELTPMLTALQHHPMLQKIHFLALCLNYLPSLSGLEALLRSQDSKVKELILENVDIRTVGLHPVLRELRRSTIVTSLSICNSTLNRKKIQLLKAVLRQNTTLQSLDLSSCALGSAGLAGIALGLYHNTSIRILNLSRNGLKDFVSACVLGELLRCGKTITSLCLSSNTFGSNAAATQSIFEGLRSNTALQQFYLEACGLGDQGISILASALANRNASTLELDLGYNDITSVGVGALVDDNVEAVKTLTKLCLAGNDLDSEAATILADALGRKAMPSLKRICLDYCDIDDDGVVALFSALEQNASLQSLDFKCNFFGERGCMALAESLPNIKGLQQVGFTANLFFQPTLPLLLEGFRKNTSLMDVDIDDDDDDDDDWCVPRDCLQELKFLGFRNRFTPLLKASDPLGASPRLGIWSRALAKVATELDVLFHVLRNKPKLVGSAGGPKKRKRNDE
jgi:Ran GTPase-activating protein (RanGAP) involved in mRNA processing and transport